MAAVQEQVEKRPRLEYIHDKEAFLRVYEKIKVALLDDPLLKDQPAEARAWSERMLDYNVPGGKLNRGMAVYDVLAALKKSEDLEEQEITQANILGWCIEWLQAFFLVADDIMDGSITRRGQPCWYRQEKVGMVACNDYILLESHIYRLLKMYFGDHPKYMQLVDLFHQVTYQTAQGQLYDLITAPPGDVDLSRFTMENYLRIVTYKTAFYTFYLPVACGMLLSGVEDEQAYKLAESVCVEMGRYFQIQDDFLDCFGDPEVIGKVGTDIEDNKCSWLVCTALQTAGEEEKKIIMDNYGRHDSNSVNTIKELYQKLGLENIFRDYETRSYEELMSLIGEQSLLPKEVFTRLLTKIYKRKK